MVAIFRTDAPAIGGRPCQLVLVCDASTGETIALVTERAHPHGHLEYLDPVTGTWLAGSLDALIHATLAGVTWSPRS